MKNILKAILLTLLVEAIITAGAYPVEYQFGPWISLLWVAIGQGIIAIIPLIGMIYSCWKEQSPEEFYRWPIVCLYVWCVNRTLYLLIMHFGTLDNVPFGMAVAYYDMKCIITAYVILSLVICLVCRHILVKNKVFEVESITHD